MQLEGINKRNPELSPCGLEILKVTLILVVADNIFIPFVRMRAENMNTLIQ